MAIELVIFDMDGTLVDSEFCAAQALCDVLPDSGVTPDFVVERYRGMKLAFILEDINRHHGVVIPEDAVQKYREQEELLGEKLISVNPGVAQFLDSLEVNCCVASNAPVAKTTRSLKNCGLYEYFNNRIYSAYDVNAWKPEPTLFLHAAHAEGYKPGQCLVVEDSDAGVSAGLSANMRTLLYNPHGRSTAHKSVESVSVFQDIRYFLS